MTTLEKPVSRLACDIVFLTMAPNAKMPAALANRDVRTVRFTGTKQLREIAPITVVDARDSRRLSEWTDAAKVFARKSPSHEPGYLVVHLGGNHDVDSQYVRSLLLPFPHLDCVEFSFDDTIGAIIDSLSFKWRILMDGDTNLTASLQGTPPRSSPLDGVKAVIAATQDLRTAGGNLAADRIAKLYDISSSKLAQWLGRTRQALAKTPDADSLQDELGYFERVARLRTVTSESGFRKWLRMPNEQLDGARPLDLMAGAQRQVVADLVDDMLTGSPV